MLLPQYLTDNVDRIKSDKQQSIQLWTKKDIEKYIHYDAATGHPSSLEHQALDHLIHRFNPAGLQREQVLQLYREDLHLGYLATLLWGGLEKVVKEKRNFISAINYPKDKVVATLEHIRDRLMHDKITMLFEELNHS